MKFWKIDPVHSEVSFKVKHLLVSTVTGHFDKFDALIETDKDDFSDAKIKFEANVKSINTKNNDRDNHLKSADFFDVEKYEKLSFVSKSISRISDYEFKVIGNMTIRGITKEISLDVIYNGVVAGFGGTEVAGFEIKTRINRFDYDLKWNAITETGGVVVSNEVKIEILAEFNKVQSDAKAA